MPLATGQAHGFLMLLRAPIQRSTGHVYPTEIAPVGNYGVGIVWSDGHSTSIYPFEALLRLASAAGNRSADDNSSSNGSAREAPACASGDERLAW
jgi:DUF971 family protein